MRLKSMKPLPLNLEEYLEWVALLDVRPSAWKIFCNEITEWLSVSSPKLYQLLEKSEDDIRSHTTITEHDFGKIKEKIEEHGLHYGMTHQEFADYLDQDYLLKHPDEKRFDATDKDTSDNTDDIVIDENELKRRIEEAIKVELVEEQPKPEWSAQEYRNFVEDNIRKGYLFKFIEADYEWMKFRSLYAAYQHQPWYYRLLYSEDKRIALAKSEADKLMECYTKNFLETVMENRLRDHEAECKRVDAKNKANEVRREAIRLEQYDQYRNELLEKRRKEAQDKQSSVENSVYSGYHDPF